MAHSHIVEKICGNHNELDLKEFKEIIEITSQNIYDKILMFIKSTPNTMLVFEGNSDFEKINLTLDGSNVTTNSWVECAYYVQNGWLPPGFIFSQGQQESYIELLNGYYFNHSYTTYIIFMILVFFQLRKKFTNT